MNLARIEKDAFRRRRLSGIDMRHDADVAHVIKHGSSLMV
jgi:hypothetical protein